MVISIVGAAAVCIALAACGAASRPGTRGHTSTGQFPTPPGAAGRAAAKRDTTVLLDSLRMPAGSVRSTCPGRPHLITTEYADALAQRCYRVRRSLDSAYRYIRNHPPPGASVMSWGSGGNPVTRSVIYSFPAVKGVLGTRLLSVEVGSVPASGSGAGGSATVDVDAQSDWIVQRAARERIPGGVRTVVVTDHGRRWVVSRRSRVQAAVGLIDSLPVVQPGVTNCPEFAMRQHYVVITFTTGGAHGTVLARARFFGRGTLYACDPVEFSVRGRRMQPLTATQLRRALGSALGISLP